MAATDSRSGLRLVSLATFRAATFLIAIVLWLHLRGVLPAFLGRLDTLSGFAAFAAFWCSTAVASRIGLGLEGGVGGTTVAGCWNGAFVFLAAFGVTTFIRIAADGPMFAAIVLPFAAMLGAIVAFSIGGIVGAVYAVAEALLFSIGRRLLMPDRC